jgi:O-antigen ligase
VLPINPVQSVTHQPGCFSVTGLFFVLKYIEYFVVFFMVVNNVHSRSQVQRFTIAMLATALIVSIVGVAQIPSGDRVSAPFEGEQGEPNTFGGYLLLMSAVATGMAFQGTNRKINSLLWVLVAFLVLPFLATLSRASYLGAPFVYLTFLVLHRKRRSAMLIALLVIIGVGTVAIPDSVKDRVLFTFEQAEHRGQMRVGGVKLDTSTSARLTSWTQSVSDFTESPIWGFGITGYKFIDAQYPRVLVETGLLGLALFFTLVFAIFKEARRVFRESADPLYKGLAMGLLAGLVGLLVHALGSNTFTIVRIMEPFWLIVGLVIGASELEKRTLRDVENVPDEPAEAAPALARLV